MITVFNAQVKPTSRKYVTVEQALSFIQSPPLPWREAVDKARELREKDKESYRTYKVFDIPVLMWAGRFVHTSTKNMIDPSGYIYFDCDVAGTDVSLLKEEPFVKAIWKSLSGKGLGGLIKTSRITPMQYSSTYKQLTEYFAKKGVRLDKTSNISRTNCYSYDTDMYINDCADGFYPKKEEALRKSHIKPIRLYKPKDYEEKCCKMAFAYVRNKVMLDFVDGQKHNFLVHYSGCTNAFGVSIDTAYQYLLTQGVSHKNAYKIMRNIYNSWSSEFSTKAL